MATRWSQLMMESVVEVKGPNPTSLLSWAVQVAQCQNLVAVFASAYLPIEADTRVTAMSALHLSLAWLSKQAERNERRCYFCIQPRLTQHSALPAVRTRGEAQISHMIDDKQAVRKKRA